MSRTAWLAPITGLRLIRRAADAGFVQVAHHRVRQLDRLPVAREQEASLLRMVRHARSTQFGRDHHFDEIRSWDDYQALVPIRDYEAFWTEYWKDHYPRLENQTWPSRYPYYALSSGTTSGTTKYIPISQEMVRSNNKAALTTMALFRHVFPRADLFQGKFFFLGGSTDLRTQEDGSLAGDLSGIATKEVADFMRPYSFPPLEVSLLSDWEVKLTRLAELSLREPITAISGVPSWVLKLFDRVKQLSGKSTVAEVWPQLELIVHGGTKFDPFREVFRREIGKDSVQYLEVYPCSEGFIATQDPRSGLLRIVPDHNIVFEFIPLEDYGKDRPQRHTLATVEPGVNYVVVLTTCAGLWSYVVGDTVMFEQRDPPLIRFTGRTKYFLSAFGEHLIQEEVEKAVAAAAHACQVDAVEHHVGPVFPSDIQKPGHHLYLVEFRGPCPDLDRFADQIDQELIRLNEDYAAHRVGDLTMLRPEVRVMPPNGFENWMLTHGRRIGGQSKVPRMDNSGELTRDLATWLTNHTPR